MSAEKKELTLLEELLQEQEKFMLDREKIQNNLQQLIGAIYANDQIIKKIQAKDATNDKAVLTKDIIKKNMSPTVRN